MAKSRCVFCNKKISVMSVECKCGNRFCIKCRYPEVHNCKYDHKKDELEILEKKLVKVVAKKIENI